MILNPHLSPFNAFSVFFLFFFFKCTFYNIKFEAWANFHSENVPEKKCLETTWLGSKDSDSVETIMHSTETNEIFLDMDSGK